MDENSLREFMTFKSGKVVFTGRFDPAALAERFTEARVLREVLLDLPVLPAMAARLEEELIVRSIFATAALEGNPLSEEAVGAIVAQPPQVRSQDQAGREIENLRKAYQRLKTLDSAGQPLLLSEQLIKQTHQAITEGLSHPHNLPGQYRDGKVKVGNPEHGGTYVPPKCLADIKNLMTELMAWLNRPELLAGPPLVRAALAHYHLGLVHPFFDGNGRTARLVEAVILHTSGLRHVPLLLSNYYYQHMDEYYEAFSRTRLTRDFTPFLSFVLDALIASLRAMKTRAAGFIRILTFRDYVTYLAGKKLIGRRQHELLKILLDRWQPFILDELFQKAPFAALYGGVSERTARRDLAKLLGLNLLLVTDEKRFAPNPAALENTLR